MTGNRDRDQHREQNRNQEKVLNREKNEESRPENERQASGEEEGAAKLGLDEPNWYDELGPWDAGWGADEEEYTGRGERRRGQKKRLKKILLAVGGALLLLLAGVGTYAYSLYTGVQEPQRILLDDATFEQDHEVDMAFSDRIVNIAVLGFDRGWSREKMGEEMFRPDMIAVLSIDFATDEVSVVRITRDAYVPIYGMSGMHDKINHSYFFGYTYGDGKDSHKDGINYTLNTISHTLGDIPIHYYISVDMYSVIELVDAMGGIYYEVEETIYDQHWDVGRVLVPKGPQVMDGKTYLRYLQYRDEATDQDYGRIERQINLLRETFVYLREQGKLADIPNTYRIYKDYVETDLSYTQIASLAYFARDLTVDDLEFHVLPGDGQTRDGIWYQILRQDERLEIIRAVFGVEAERWPPIVLEDSPEYLEEQERLRREEEREKRFRDDDRPSIFEDNPEEEQPGPDDQPGGTGDQGDGTGDGAGDYPAADEEGESGAENQEDLEPEQQEEPAADGGSNDNRY